MGPLSLVRRLGLVPPVPPVLLLALVPLLGGLAGPARAAPPPPTEVVSGAWIEEQGGRATLVVGLYRRAGSPGPAKAFVGLSVPGEQDLPGGYGVIAKEAWTEVALEAGSVLRVERALKTEERERPPAVLVATAVPPGPVDVHELIHGERPAGSLLFARPYPGGPLTLSRHVLEIGETADLVLAAPAADFFHDQTLEVAVVTRRLGIDSDDPDGAAGHARLVWQPPAGESPAPARELRGEEGAQRVRSHFSDPACAWANRHIGWMETRWVVEYLRATPLRFRVETEGVKRPGRVADLWKGYGAVTIEAIYPNGFGGSSSNLDLPPILVVPKGTPVRRLSLP